MNGREILEHFSQRLAAVEGQLPISQPILRLESPPDDFTSLSSSYQGTPAVFPASWIPEQALISLSSTLQQLLCNNILQVDVFRLQYHIDNGEYHDTVCTQFKNDLEPINCPNDTLCHLLEKQSLFPIPMTTTELMDFEEFLSQLSNTMESHQNQLLYLAWRSLPEASSQSMPDEFSSFVDRIVYPVTTPAFIAKENIKQRNLWMGAMVTSRIHFDAMDNLHVCLLGKKILHLYSPSELPNLYPETWTEGQGNNFSSIGSALIAKKHKHPRFFQNVKRFTTEINPGEAIFIPAGWWHEVFTLQETVSMNVWFRPNTNAYLRPTLLHLKSDKYLKFMLQHT